MGEALDVANRYYTALAGNDAKAVAALLTDDAAVNVPGGGLTGPAQCEGWMQSFFDAFPDITHAHDALEENGDTVSTTVHVAGTHTAPLVSPDGALPATGKKMVIAARNTMRISDGRIAELTIEFDQADFMRQLGM